MQERAVFSHLITSYYGAPLMVARRSGLIVEITDGTASTIMIDELRIGPVASDLRGTWALGQTGASISAGNGRIESNEVDLAAPGSSLHRLLVLPPGEGRGKGADEGQPSVSVTDHSDESSARHFSVRAAW